MRYLSVCSGIEATTVAWHPLGWAPMAFSEIEAFPSAVLAHHYPNVPNWGDMTNFKEWPDDTDVDVLVGGTPCQSFSVAGLRRGLADPRGNLALTYLAIAERYCPDWLVWENVPGVLSADDGRAFGALLGGMEELGYGWAYRTLDAQYHGVAQRRRRVFVVGSARGWAAAASVLFEPDSLRGHPAPRREARERIAGSLAACSFTGGAGGRPEGAAAGHFIPEIANPLTHRMHKGINTTADEGQTPIVCAMGEKTHALTGEGFDASEDGTGRGTPVIGFSGKDYGADADEHTSPTLRAMGHDGSHANAGGQVAVAFESMHDTLPTQGVRHGENDASTKQTNARAVLRTLREAVGEEAFTEWGLGVLDSFQPSQVLQSHLYGKGIRREDGQIRSSLDDGASPREEVSPSGALCAVRKAGRQRRTPQEWRLAEQLAGELGTHLSELPHQRASPAGFLLGLWQASEGLGVLRQALSAFQEVGRSSNGETQSARKTLSVRRITPREAERLQGFPDDYTLIPYRNGWAKDGPRYKALGNSMAVPVMGWIGRRVAAVATLLP